jgi:rod shape-determining protein MreC
VNLKFRQFFLLAIPLRTAIAQVSVGALLLSALVLMFMAREHAQWLDSLRLRVNAGIEPALVFVQTPVRTVEDWFADLQQLTVLQQENKTMQDEMAGLRTWHLEAVRLESENRALRNLLHMKQTQEVASTAGNVLSDNGSSYGHSVLVAVPADFRLQPGLVAMTGDGMVGRTIEFSNTPNLTRVLLLDDPASRIPVVLANSKTAGILAGHSAGHLALENLPSDTPAQVDELILSAGNDGVLPPGLPLARVVEVTPDHISVKSLAPLDRLDWLRLVDFGTATVLTKPSFQSQ